MRIAGERANTGRQLVQHHAERKDVGALVDAFPLGLLRRHVIRRADEHARARAERRHRVFRRGNVDELGNPEIGRSITFSGLMSRWTIIRECAAASALAI